MKKKIKFLLVVLWMVCIFSFSHQVGKESDALTLDVIDTGVKVTENITHTQIPEKKVESFTEKVFTPLRKTSHFFEYLLLGILLYSYLWEFDIKERKRKLLTIGICFLYACSDEIHQLFRNGRAARILDVFIDSTGASLGTMIAFLLYRVYEKKKLGSVKESLKYNL